METKSLNPFLTAVVVLLAWTAPAQAVNAPREVNAANRLLEEGKIDESLQKYRKALGEKDSPVIDYNLGTALYKKGDYRAAMGHLRKAALSGDKHVGNAAKYNLGGTFYKHGIGQEEENIDGAIKDLEQSVDIYNEVLKTDAKDLDAQYNKEYVQKQLERLKQKKEEQQKQQQKDQEQQKQDQQKSDQQDQDQQQKQDPQDEKKKEQSDKKEDRQEEQKQSDRQDPDQNKEEQGSQGKPQGNDMTPQEAKNILEDYQRNEEPKGLLNFVPRENSSEKPVEKDW